MSENMAQIDNKPVCSCILHAIWTLEFHEKGHILHLHCFIFITTWEGPVFQKEVSQTMVAKLSGPSGCLLR